MDNYRKKWLPKLGLEAIVILFKKTKKFKVFNSVSMSGFDVQRFASADVATGAGGHGQLPASMHSTLQMLVDVPL
ncbi:hypothetical protein [Peribacillus glennii]|uniref:Uncharacterized protein n=1 Tax=Peribacillus glennii TaxID=2303991 RepID=A0A372LGN6_9BACI|nr:hypothetical protein [Peribacillus glennii]RFU65461.1 hypothetical protein D0466_06120 [Peribacillus glennii]